MYGGYINTSLYNSNYSGAGAPIFTPEFEIISQLSMNGMNIVKLKDPNPLSTNTTGTSYYLQSAATVNWVQQNIGSIITNYVSNNSIAIQKLLFSGNGSQFLCSDGVFRSS